MTPKTATAPAIQPTRERILDVAAGLIVERGYEATPLSAIAAAADLTKAALYYHFPSKIKLLSGIVSPLLSEVDQLLAGTPEQFQNAEQRWHFMLEYTNLLLSRPRAVRVLASINLTDVLPSELSDRIDSHRSRTTQLAMLPGMSDEARVRAILVMDMLNRETVFTEDRIVVPGMSPAVRRDIVYRFARETLEG